MWLPRSFGEAFPAAILSLVCWGSWSNAAKEATGRGVPFPHFYVDWSVGAFVTAVTCWLAMGGAELEAPNNADGEATESVNRWRVASAVGAGTIFNVANALLILGINLAGLSVAFPMGIGTALVLGTTLTYLVESAAGNSPSSAPLLFVGVAVGLLAVVTIAAADWLKRTSRGVAGGYSAIGNVGPAVKKGTKGSTDVEAALASSQKRRGSVQSDESDTDVAVVGGHETPQPPPAAIVEEARISSGGRMKAKIAPPSDATYTPLGVVDEGAAVGPLKAAGVCLLAGLLMSCWGPLSTYAQDNSSADNGALNPYSTFVLYCAAVLITSLHPSPLSIFLVRAPMGDLAEPFSVDSYYDLPLSHHMLGWVGGAIWAVGTLSNLLAGRELGFAAAFAIGQSAPMVATGWGVFYYREFAGASTQAWGCLLLMVCFFFGAIALIAFGS